MTMYGARIIQVVPRFCLMIVVGFVSFAGCNQQTPIPPTPPLVVDEGPIEQAEVELSEPKVSVDSDGNFMFEFKYRFVKGRARQFYLVTVHFPGTHNLCLKHMEAYELKQQEGVIRDGIPLVDRPIKTYEITMSEADSPMNQYQLISNVLTGKMEP